MSAFMFFFSGFFVGLTLVAALAEGRNWAVFAIAAFATFVAGVVVR